MITSVELTKLLNSAIEAARKCGGGGGSVDSEAPDPAEEGRAVDALRLLAQQQVTTELLTETEAGKRLKKLSKHTSKKVADASTAAVEAWKECIRKEQQAGASKGAKGAVKGAPGTAGSAATTTTAAAAAAAAAAGGGGGGSGDDNGGTQGEGSQPSGTDDFDAAGGSQQSFGGGMLNRTASNKLILEPAKTGDETRDKIRKIMAEALAVALSPSCFGDPCSRAVEAEKALYTQSGGVNQKYKAKFRSLSFNLKDPKNPDLRAKVLTGEIPGEVLVTLSPEEMASSETRAKNDAIRENMKNEAVRGQQNQASTDMFKCGKCKQKKCTYYQLQTRSADEPMTTFVTCTNCGNRWKFC